MRALPRFALAAALGSILLKDARGQNAIGVRGSVGCADDPKKVQRLQITKPGIFENYLVDSEWSGGNRVKITADGVTVRNCEIRNIVFGPEVQRRYHLTGGGRYPGFRKSGETDAPPFDELLRKGVPKNP